MAKQIITLLTDDLDGGDADRTIEFGLDGVNFTIDLSENNAGKLRKALEPYLTAAAKVGQDAGPGEVVGGEYRWYPATRNLDHRVIKTGCPDVVLPDVLIEAGAVYVLERRPPGP